jgi:hypothetical protein
MGYDVHEPYENSSDRPCASVWHAKGVSEAKSWLAERKKFSDIVLAKR